MPHDQFDVPDAGSCPGRVHEGGRVERKCSGPFPWSFRPHQEVRREKGSARIGALTFTGVCEREIGAGEGSKISGPSSPPSCDLPNSKEPGEPSKPLTHADGRSLSDEQELLRIHEAAGLHAVEIDAAGECRSVEIYSLVSRLLRCIHQSRDFLA
jgi:hypothetical protein